MIFHYGKIAVPCDNVTETDGRYTLYQFGAPIMSFANVPPSIEILAEDGEIEHVPTPLEAAEDEINDLQADLAGAMSKLAQVRDLILNLGDGLTLTKLVQFVKDLREILADFITEASNNG